MMEFQKKPGIGENANGATMSRRRRKSRSTNQEAGFKPIKLVARSKNQIKLIREIRDNDVTLCTGPAGSGKTHVAVASAVKALRTEQVRKIILCRPVVDVGTSIGYLPGDMQAKVGPYLVPLFDELAYYINLKHINRLMEEGRIEICPLSMMRGRTFNNSFVILDEAQNAVTSELKMFLTRIGMGTKMVLVGDLCQSDLPARSRGAFRGIVEAVKFTELLGVASVELKTADIVRHPLIANIRFLFEGYNG